MRVVFVRRESSWSPFAGGILLRSQQLRPQEGAIRILLAPRSRKGKLLLARRRAIPTSLEGTHRLRYEPVATQEACAINYLFHGM